MVAPARPSTSDPQSPILLFDGVCNLCHGSVRFILGHEREPIIRFGTLQSAIGRELLTRHGLDPDALNSLVLLEGDRSYAKSAAVLRLARYLRAPWSWCRIFRIVPRVVRDWMYDRVAASRYRIFGRRDACVLPTGDGTKGRVLSMAPGESGTH